LGAEIARLTSQAGCDILSGYNTHLPLAGSPIRLDLMNPDEAQQLIRKARPDLIIHTAAISDVDLCEQKPDIANAVNGEATGKIGGIAAKLGAYVIYVSTDYVFDGATGSYQEEDKPNPVNHYGRSKLLGENLLKETGARYCIARTSVVYGWGREHRANFATWVLSKLKSNQPLTVVDDQFASPTLNLNLVEMILELAMKRWEGIIHLAGATRVDRYNFAKCIAETFHYDPNLIEPVKSQETEWKAKRPTDSSLNVGKAEKLLEKRPLELNKALERFQAKRH
jgi:dTDP-4-dehydrorhamnose reductase